MVTAAFPAADAQAASSFKLSNGMTVPAVDIAGWVASGTTPSLLVLKTEAGNFNITIDDQTKLGSTKYLNNGAIIALDVYAGIDGKFHAGNITYNSNNNYGSGTVVINPTSSGIGSSSSSGSSSSASSSSDSSSSVDLSKTTKVKGRVRSGSTTKMLLLDTDQGNMEIKLDSSTKWGTLKYLMGDDQIYAYIYNGGDGYNHAAQLDNASDYDLYSSSGVNKSNIIPVNGTVKSGSRYNLIKFDTASGDMLIRIDNDTDASEARVIQEGTYATIKVAGSSDGYLHAISIVSSDTTNDTGMLTGQSTTTKYGVVQDSSTDAKLKIKIGDEVKTFRLDSGSKGINSSAIVPGEQYAVSYYKGSDDLYHVATYANVDGHDVYTDANIDSNNTCTMYGTVKSTSSNRTLRLDCSGVEAEIRLQTSTDVSKCRIMNTGREVIVKCAYGDDAYWHAVSIEEDD